ncbi:uncharacterized protein LOC141726243 [Zonotrichia albicollis]|uniref:uncharacterized protein LOC141726243 n=1 Tax=Zonotrichia albicollis TaxID=44394 RepID=UPI003D80C69F
MPLPATPPASREPEYHSGPRGPAESAKIPAKIEKKDPVMGAAILPETTCRHGRRHVSEPRGYPDALDAPPRDAAGLTRTGISFRPPGTRGKRKNPGKNREKTSGHGGRHLAGNHVSAWAPPSCRNHVSAWAPPSCRTPRVGMGAAILPEPRVGMGAAILPETTCLHQRRHLSEPRGYPDALDAPPRDAAGLTRTGISFRSPETRGKRKNPGKNREKRSGHGGRHLAGNHVSAWAPPCIRAQRLPRRLRCPSPRRRRPHPNRNIIPAPGDPRKAQKSRQKSRKNIWSWGPPSCRKPRVGTGAAILPETTCRHGRRHLAGIHVSVWAPPSCRKPRVFMGAAILPETTCRHGRRHLGLGSTTQQP